ncbi:hypothetical protein [Terasakiella pusilla]|uniref:hypothetical protein n=1 Tax=Terasakiella pusilla TaxID=64973 RepID=UPI003AA9113F
MIDHKSLEQAAMSGYGLDHLTPAQAWAAHSKGVALEKLTRPLSGSVKVLLEHHARKAEKAFRRAAKTTEEVIDIAYDEAYPAWLRKPLQDILREGMRKHFPDLKPTAVDDNGNPLYSAADMAKTFGVEEDDLHEFAEREGYADSIYSGPVNPIH